jgi:H+/Cl- antiporter ClcA
MQRERFPVKGYFFLGVAVFLFVVSVSIVWQLTTTQYPTHSDVFYMGVEFGVLSMLLLVCIVLISLLLYRAAMLSRKSGIRKETK